MRVELRALALTSLPPEPGESIMVADAFGDLATVGGPAPATASMTATVGATGRPTGIPGNPSLDATRVQPGRPRRPDVAGPGRGPARGGPAEHHRGPVLLLA